MRDLTDCDVVIHCRTSFMPLLILPSQIPAELCFPPVTALQFPPVTELQFPGRFFRRLLHYATTMQRHPAIHALREGQRALPLSPDDRARAARAAYHGPQRGSTVDRHASVSIFCSSCQPLVWKLRFSARRPPCTAGGSGCRKASSPPKPPQRSSLCVTYSVCRRVQYVTSPLDTRPFVSQSQYVTEESSLCTGFFGSQ